MARFLQGLFAEERKDDQTRRATSLPSFARGRAYLSDWSVERAVRDGYERSIWVFRGIDAIATNASRLPIVFRKGSEKGPEISYNEPLDDLLNVKASEFETAAAFRYRLSSQLLLSKKGAFVESNRTGTGDVGRLTLLPPQYTDPVPDPNTFVARYELNVNGVIEPVPPEVVTWIRKPHPIDPYSGVTSLQPAGISIDLDYYARLYNRTFMANDGRPGGVLAVKGDLDVGDADEMKRRVAGGPAQAGRMSVIEADSVTFVDTSVSPRDAAYVEGQKQTSDDILLSLGVPRSIIGDASGRTYDNAAAEKSIFWQETMQGHLDLVGGGFHPLTRGGWDDDVFVVHDTSGVDVLQRARREAEEHEQKMVVGGLKSPDEGRLAVGLVAFDVPASKALYMTTTLAAVAIRKEDEDPEAPLPVGQSQTPTIHVHVGGDGGQATPSSNGNGSAAGNGSGGGVPPELVPAARAVGAARTENAAEHPFAGAGLDPAKKARTTASDVAAARRRQERWKKTIAETFRRHFRRQEKVAIERLRSVKVRQGTRHWRAEGGPADRHSGTKAIDASALFDRARWNEELRADFQPIVEDIYAENREVAGLKSRLPIETKAEGDDFEDDPEYEAALEARLGQGDLVNQTTEDQLRDSINEGEAAGETLDDLEGRVRDVFGTAEDSRADDIGWTNAVGANNEGSLLAASEFGEIVSGKYWFSAQDDHVRPSHVDADDRYGESGEPIPLDQAFDVGADSLMYPGDPSGSPEEIINCRCVAGSTPVLLEGLRAATRRWYEGEMIVVETSLGHRLTVTPNHPVAGPTGWVAAGDLREGDYVLGRSDGQVSGRVDPDEENVPASAEKLYEAAALASSRVERIAGSGVDFYGDGRDGEVEVAIADDELALWFEPEITEEALHLGVPAAERKVSRAGRSSSFARVAHSEIRRLAPVAAGDSGGTQTGRDYLATCSESLGESVLARPGEVQADDLLGVDGVPGAPPSPSRLLGPLSLRGRVVEPSTFEFALQRPPGRPSDPRCVSAVSSFDVRPDRVLRLLRRRFAGHVYDFDTGTGRFMAGGIVVSNCTLQYALAEGGTEEVGAAEDLTTAAHSLAEEVKAGRVPEIVEG